MGLSYSVLGPLEVRDGECLVPLTRAKDRVLLATLLIRANQVVSTDQLLEVLWGDNPPASGAKALQFHISSLRDVLNPGRTGSASTCLQTRSPGYVLETATQDIDAHRCGLHLLRGQFNQRARQHVVADIVIAIRPRDNQQDIDAVGGQVVRQLLWIV